MTLTLCKAEDFQRKPILKVPKDVILIYSLSPLNGAAWSWQRFSSLTFREHTILFLSGAFQNKAQGLSRSFKGCQSCSKLRFIPATTECDEQQRDKSTEQAAPRTLQCMPCSMPSSPSAWHALGIFVSTVTEPTPAWQRH